MIRNGLVLADAKQWMKHIFWMTLDTHPNQLVEENVAKLIALKCTSIVRQA